MSTTGSLLRERAKSFLTMKYPPECHHKLDSRLFKHAIKGKMSCILRLTEEEQNTFKTFTNLSEFYASQGIKIKSIYNSPFEGIVAQNTNSIDSDLLFSWD